METRVVLSAAVLAVLLCAGHLAAQSVEDVQVRLVDGLTPHEGRLEVLYNDTWGTVCDRGGNYRYSEVVCRLLGFKNGIAKSFGSGSSDQPIHMSILRCSGSEDNIAQCSQRGWGVHDCGNRNDAGVICLQEEDEDVQVRLVGGQTENEGRVEVLYNGTWGTVCNDYRNDWASTVVCRMLGLPPGLGVLSSFGPGSPNQSIHMSNVGCTGSEDNIGRCPHRGWGIHSCSHNNDAGVICLQPGEEDVQVRLVGGLTENEGRVEVLYNGTWGTVCDYQYYWDDNDASVVCGMFNRSMLEKRWYSIGGGPESQTIHMSYVGCNGSEDNIGRCPHRVWGVHSCGHDNDVGVICGEPGAEDVQVRLVGGLTENEGRVEVLYKGTWGTVCGYNWDYNDASVVCRMLNKSVLVSASYEFGAGSPSQPIHMSYVSCTGSEDNIGRCPHRGWGVNDCRHYSDIGVICAERDQEKNVQTRLVGGQTSLEGRVEVFYNDTWGAVCWDNSNQQEAAVVCRTLGLPDGSVFDASYLVPFGQGQASQPNHLNVRCAGSERNLGHCPHDGWGARRCARRASVYCLQPGDTVGNVRLSGGPSAREGRLEVARGVYWGTVCDDQFDARDAAVVCRSLGFSGAAQAVPGAYYGEGEGQVMLTRLGCTGQESFLFQCPQQSPSPLSCPHSQDVGVICHNEMARWGQDAEVEMEMPDNSLQAPLADATVLEKRNL